MKILGITAEYNPFHNGHKYHIEKAKELSGADYTVVVMSGNFTQRGEPAVLDKWQRAELAVKNGADIVLELPFVFACSQAEKFASGAVDILKGFGATHIAFGSESGDLSQLQSLAGDLIMQNEQISVFRLSEMKKGLSYAKANYSAVQNVLGKERAELLLQPNNILAIEYLKRMKLREKNGHVLTPVAVKRHGSGYFDYDETSGFAGATVIRGMQSAHEVAKYVPENVAQMLLHKASEEKINERFFEFVRAEIVKSSPESLRQIYCVGEGFENKLKKEVVRAENMEAFVQSLVSGRYTQSAVKRMLVYILMGIREKDPGDGIYARVLALGNRGKQVLKELKKKEMSSIPIITNVNKEAVNYEGIAETLKYDMLASDMYNLVCARNLYDFSDKVKMPYIEC